MLHDHNDHVTSVNFLYLDENILFITTGKDSSANVYKYQDGKVTRTYQYNSGAAITGCAVHPLQYLILLCSNDGTFSFHDIQKNLLLSRVTEFKGLV